MDTRLIKQLQEEDLFKAPTEAEIVQRKANKPIFKCPLCKKEVPDITVEMHPEPQTGFVAVSPGGTVETANIEWDYSLSQGEYTYTCPHCSRDISEYIEQA